MAVGAGWRGVKSRSSRLTFSAMRGEGWGEGVGGSCGEEEEDKDGDHGNFFFFFLTSDVFRIFSL